MRHKISIIIIHYNNDADTTECLLSLDKLKTNHQVEIVLIDNNSHQPYQLPKITLPINLIRSKQNLGFAGGNNLGITHAMTHFQPDYLLLINNDTLVEPTFVDKLVDMAQAKPDVGCVSPKIYFAPGYEYHVDSYSKSEQGKVIWFAGGSIDWQNMYGFHRAVDEVDHGQTDLPIIKRGKQEIPYFGYEVMDFASGCCMLLPKKVIEQVGMLDESYFMYWEDVDLSMRITQAGYQLYYCPEAVIWHKNAGASGGAGSAFHQKYQQRNRLKFALKYAPWKTKLLVFKDYLGL